MAVKPYASALDIHNYAEIDGMSFIKNKDKYERVALEISDNIEARCKFDIPDSPDESLARSLATACIMGGASRMYGLYMVGRGLDESEKAKIALYDNFYEKEIKSMNLIYGKTAVSNSDGSYSVVNTMDFAISDDD